MMLLNFLIQYVINLNIYLNNKTNIMYFDEKFYTEMLEKTEVSETKKTEHSYYKLMSGEWLCLSCTYKAVKKENWIDWEKISSDSSVSMDKPGEPGKDDYIKRLLEIANPKI